MTLDRSRLDALYEMWNRPEYISPDPLETLSLYPDAGDREVAALLASSMAYGRVNSILPPLRSVLAVMGGSPRQYVCERSERDMAGDLEGIVHRFARAPHIAALLAGTGRLIRDHSNLQTVFLKGYRRGRGDVVEGLRQLAGEIRTGSESDPGHLLADPNRGSACKRLLLFLRWMVRRDEVDPGGWEGVRPADLLLPLDTWTHRIALRAGWTNRGGGDMKTVREVSAALSRINPGDPVRYDFALSRFGIRAGLSLDQLFGGPPAPLPA